MSDLGSQKGPASTAEIARRIGEAINVEPPKQIGPSPLASLPGLYQDLEQSEYLALHQQARLTEPMTFTALSEHPPITAESMRASLLKMVNQMRERFDNRDRIDFLCMTKATWELLKDHPDMQSEEARKLHQGLPVEVFDSEFECVLHIRMRYMADGKNGLLVKGPEITV